MPHSDLSFGPPAKAVMSMCVQNFVEALSYSRISILLTLVTAPLHSAS